MKTPNIFMLCAALLLGMVGLTALKQAWATPSQTPLFLSIQAAKPNIMLMMDNSMSMNTHVVVTNDADISPSNMPAGTSSYNCTGSGVRITGDAATAAAATTIVNMVVSAQGQVQVCLNAACTNKPAFGFTSGKKCFRDSSSATYYYQVKYYNGATLGTFTGRQLNWYFSDSDHAFEADSLDALQSTDLGTRLSIIKTAATALVDSITPATGESTTLRLGLSTYNGTTGAKLLNEIKNLNGTQASAIKTNINALTASSYTPLAETLSDIGHYFARGYSDSSNLTLHPSKPTPTTATVAQVFRDHNIQNSTGSATLASPIQSYCQKSFVVLLSDGLPTEDRSISTYLQDYDGDCTDAGSSKTCRNNCSGETATPTYDMDNEFSYECGIGGPSDFLDDVAQALYEIDLRPDLEKPSSAFKNNLTIYTVGFADPSIDPTITGVNPLLKNTAIKGGGQFFYAANTGTLTTALQDTVTSISAKVGAAAAVAANSSQLGTDTTIYQAKFDSYDWTGSLLALDLDNAGNIVSAPLWNAAEEIPAWNLRNIVTYNPTSHTGVTFQCENLSTGQKDSLNIDSNCSSDGMGIWRLDYIRGDYSHEKINPLRRDTQSEIRPNGGVFRNRTHLDRVTLNKTGSDPWLLGDIVNSNPVFVGTDDFGYSNLSTEGSSYTTYRTSDTYRSRPPMVYVGANDGMLHGFNASASGENAGKELLAYVPNAVYDNLRGFSDPDYIYDHNYFVDGSPVASDVYIDPAGGNGTNKTWRTVVVGTTGAGGKGVFALDVTNPTSFTASNVLWEFSTSDAPLASDRTTDTASFRGFQQNLGFTMAQASIARMHDGSWAAIVGNGYDSVNKKAVLYIVNVQNGNVIRAISTETGSAAAPNGLSTPAPVDIDGDRIIDYLYAGDLQGNLWKFDVNSTSASSWSVAYSGSPLFVACDRTEESCTHRQPITAMPEVGPGPAGGYMIYFGTGKYFESGDSSLASPQTQTFYAIWDTNGTVASRSALQAQTITTQTNGLRLTSSNTVNYPTAKGWYMDLLPPGATASVGERVINYPQLVNGRIVFTTLIPLPPEEEEDQCGGASGTGWLMEMTGLTGTPLPSGGPAPWDINGDGQISGGKDANGNTVTNNGDKIDGNNVSGKQSDSGIPTNFIRLTKDDSSERKIYQGSSGELENELESRDNNNGAPSGRLAWKQLR